MRKYIIILIAVFCLFVISGSVLAASSYPYKFEFHPPLYNSMNSTVLKTVNPGDSPFVWPSYSATPTNYFLSPVPKSSINATNIITNVYTAGKRSFTYRPGYGGVGTSYCLSGSPTYYDFTDYKVEGYWSP